MTVYKVPFGSLKVKKFQHVANRGRPRKIPTDFVNEDARLLFKRQETHVKKDAILKRLSKDSNSFDVVDAIVREFATEASILGFERDQLTAQGKDATGVSHKRLTALRLTADSFFRKKELIDGKSLDLKSPEVMKLIEFVLLKVRSSCFECDISEELVQVLFNTIVDKLDNVEPEMKAFIMDTRKK